MSPLLLFLNNLYAQDKRKHRGPSSKITPKSREFIETDSSSSSSECQSDGEDANKVPSLPPQATRSAVNTQTLANSHIHTPLLPCLGVAGGAGNLGAFAGTGLRGKDGGGVTTSGSVANNLLSVSSISASFGNSVPDPGGSGGQGKDVEPVSPSPNIGHAVVLSPLREYPEVQSLWVKIDLSFLSRVPGPAVRERSRMGAVERDSNAGRDKERQKMAKGERQEEENERLVKDKERQSDRLTDRERQTDREDRFAFGERERTAARDREKISQGLGVLDLPPGHEQNNPRLAGRMERVESGGKHRRQAAANMGTPTEKHISKSKRKHKVGTWTKLSINLQPFCSFYI